MCREELTGRVCAIHLEAFVWAREFLDETEVVKRGGDVEEFGVEVKLSLTAVLGREQVNADRVIEEQICGMLSQKICGLFRKQGIGNGQVGGYIRHRCILSGPIVETIGDDDCNHTKDSEMMVANIELVAVEIDCERTDERTERHLNVDPHKNGNHMILIEFFRTTRSYAVKCATNSSAIVLIFVRRAYESLFLILTWVRC